MKYSPVTYGAFQAESLKRKRQEKSRTVKRQEIPFNGIAELK